MYFFGTLQHSHSKNGPLGEGQTAGPPRNLYNQKG
jgi:hypothetical protein